MKVLIFLIISILILSLSLVSPETEIGTGIGGVNIEIPEAPTTAQFLPINFTVVAGTLDSGNLSSINVSDTNSLNISEASGSPAMTLQINFSGVTGFSNIIMREFYSAGSGHTIRIGIWHCTNNNYEEEHPPDITDMDGFAFSLINVLDPTNHICDGNVSVQLRHIPPGNPAHDFFLDFIALQLGATTIVANEVDPLALHRSGDTTLLGQWNYGSFGINGSGAITTTGTITAEQLTSTDDLSVTDLATIGNLDVDTTNINAGVISDSDGIISFDNDNLHTSGFVKIGATTTIDTSRILEITKEMNTNGAGIYTSVTRGTSGGTIDGIVSQVRAGQDIPVTTGIGVHILDGDADNRGEFNALVGLQIDAQTKGIGFNIAISTSGGDLIFNGNTSIGSNTIPSMALDVTGDANITGNLTIGGNLSADTFIGDWNGGSIFGDVEFINNNFNGSGNFTTSGDVKVNNVTVDGVLSITNNLLANGIRLGTDEVIIYSTNAGAFVIRAVKPTDSPKLSLRNDQGTAQAFNFMAGQSDHLSLIPVAGFDYYMYEDSSSGENKVVRQYGYITISSNPKYVSWRVEDTSDTFLLDREDTNVLGFAINMSTKIGGTGVPTHPLQVVGDNGTDVTAWFEKNISATGFITRTSVFDSSKNAFNYIKDSSYYFDGGEINHSKFYGYTIDEIKRDTSRPVVIDVEVLVCDEVDEDGEEICHNEIVKENTYPYSRFEEGVLLDAEVNVLRQAIYNITIETCARDNTYSWC